MTRDELLRLPPMIPVPVAGRILGLRSRSAAYRAAARGELPTIRMCGKLLVPTEPGLRRSVVMSGSSEADPEGGEGSAWVAGVAA
jgi:hypothetical protein